MQLAFYYDQCRCTGCQTCVVACKDWNNVPAGPAAWRRVQVLEQGRFPQISVSFLGFNCFPCAQPACVPVCPSGALSKRPSDGIVVVSQELCLPRCQACLRACPYRAPQFREEGAPMEMCHFCVERTRVGLAPICVEACPQRAIDLGPQEALHRKYPGAVPWVDGYPHPSLTQPSLLIKAKKLQQLDFK